MLPMGAGQGKFRSAWLVETTQFQRAFGCPDKAGPRMFTAWCFLMNAAWSAIEATATTFRTETVRLTNGTYETRVSYTLPSGNGAFTCGGNTPQATVNTFFTTFNAASAVVP